MSVSSEITRIKNAKASLKTSINSKTDSQHQITTETIDDYADFVDSIQTGGGQPNLQTKSVTITTNGNTVVTADSGYDGLDEVDIITNVSGGGSAITNISELNNQLKTNFQSFETYLSTIKNNYEAYVDTPVTLYSPEGFPNYVIHKRSNGKYRIIWSSFLNIVYLVGTNVTFGGLKVNNINFQGYSAYDIASFQNMIFDIKITTPTNGAPVTGYDPRAFYYSNEFQTISDLISAITNANGNISYTKYINGYSFSGVADTPNIIPCTNCAVWDNNNNFLTSKRISSSETIVTK